MTPEEQLEHFGVAAVAIGGKVHVIDRPLGAPGNVKATLAPADFRRWMFNAARALFDAEIQATGTRQTKTSKAVIS